MIIVNGWTIIDDVHLFIFFHFFCVFFLSYLQGYIYLKCVGEYKLKSNR